MKNDITQRYEKQIQGTISCFDRLILSGTLQSISYHTKMSHYLYEHKIKFFDYLSFAETIRDRIKEAVTAVAERNGQDIRYLRSYKIRKECIVRAKLETRGDKPGLVCILSILEGCNIYRPRYNQKAKHPERYYTASRCLHYYVYFIDPVLGLSY